MTRHSMRMHQLLLPCFVLLGLVAAQGDALALGSTPITVTNPADIAKAEGVQTPVSIALSNPHNFPAPPNFPTEFQVPSNQRLIIEYASGSCDVLAGFIQKFGVQIVSGGTTDTHLFNFATVNTVNTFDFATENFGHTVRIYAPPGSTISLVGQIEVSLPPTPSKVVCDATLSGQLVDVP